MHADGGGYSAKISVRIYQRITRTSANQMLERHEQKFVCILTRLDFYWKACYMD